MFVRIIYVFVLTITLSVCKEAVKCPDPKLLEPCSCMFDSIINYKLVLECNGSSITDLAPIFANLSKNLPQNRSFLNRHDGLNDDMVRRQ